MAKSRKMRLLKLFAKCQFMGIFRRRRGKRRDINGRMIYLLEQQKSFMKGVEEGIITRSHNNMLGNGSALYMAMDVLGHALGGAYGGLDANAYDGNFWTGQSDKKSFPAVLKLVSAEARMAEMAYKRYMERGNRGYRYQGFAEDSSVIPIMDRLELASEPLRTGYRSLSSNLRELQSKGSIWL